MNKTSALPLIKERYQLGEVLGWGGMGTVYRAHDLMLDRDVAIKLLSNGALGAEARERMLREAKVAARLNHPNIVQVYDAGEVAAPPGLAAVDLGPWVPYIVMELVDGNSLHDRPPPDFQTMIQVARQICAALEQAHTHGIVHRDLKPENVLIGGDGSAKLMDFGLARSFASRITSEGKFSGTVLYLAPEIALGHELDGRADLYSLGVMLYEMATGTLPFAGDDPLVVVSQHLHAQVTAPRVRNPDLPLILEGLILDLMAKSPEDRPASAALVNERLSNMEPGLAVWDASRLREIEHTRRKPMAWLSLLRRCWRANRPIISRQAIRGGRGAAIVLALFGATRPLQVALTTPADYQVILEFLSIPAWVLLSAFAMAFFGGLQGFASGLSVGLADALRAGGQLSPIRLLFASLAGLAHTAFLAVFSLLELFPPAVVGPKVFMPWYTFYGLFLGAALSFVVPVLGTTRSTWQQLKTASWMTLLLWAATIPPTYFIYGEQTATVLPFRLGFAASLVFGLGLALAHRGRSHSTTRTRQSKESPA